jgi:cytohesin
VADSRESELFAAAFAGDGRRVSELLALGVSPAARDADGSTVLYQAVGHAWVVGLLLSAGAPPDELSGGDGEGTPLCRGACFGLRESVQTLLAGGADPNAPEDDGFTPLLWAVVSGSDECAHDILEAGADPNLASASGSTPLHYAAERGSLQLTRLLLEYGARQDASDDAGRTPSALAQAWVGKDVEAELRDRLLSHAPDGSVAETRHTVLVQTIRPGGGGVSHEMECGHREIVELLQSEL